MTHSSITVRFFLRSCRVRDWHRLSCAPGSLPRPFRQPSLGLREPSRRAGKGWSKLMQGSMQACSMAVGQACGLHQLGRGQAKQCRRCLRPDSQLTPPARSRTRPSRSPVCDTSPSSGSTATAVPKGAPHWKNFFQCDTPFGFGWRRRRED